MMLRTSVVVSLGLLALAGCGSGNSSSGGGGTAGSGAAAGAGGAGAAGGAPDAGGTSGAGGTAGSSGAGGTAGSSGAGGTAGSSGACPGNAVLSYPDAIHDTAFRKQPAPPAMGPAGSVVTDPTFGSRILRVTDADTMAGTTTTFKGRSFLTPASAEINTFNADDTRFVVGMYGGWQIAYNFDPATFKATCIKSYPNGSKLAPPQTGCANLPVGSEFSYTNPDWIYGTRTDANGHILVSRFDFSSGSTKDFLDLDSVIGSVPKNNDVLDINASATERINVSFGDIQNMAPYDLVYDVNTGKHHLLDVAKSTIDGKALGFSVLGQSGGTGIHNAQISMDGRYVMVVIEGSSNGGHLIWDVDGATAYWMPNYSGHFILGHGQVINQTNVLGNNDKAVSFVIRGLDKNGIAAPKSLLPVVTSGTYFPFDSHPSWNNARPCASAPALVSFDFYSANTALAYGGEIDAFATDGSGTMWRFAFNYSVDTGDFWDQTRGNVSQDGRFFMFNSNWGKALGSDSQGGYRHDVFIVDLLSAHQ